LIRAQQTAPEVVPRHWRSPCVWPLDACLENLDALPLLRRLLADCLAGARHCLLRRAPRPFGSLDGEDEPDDEEAAYYQ